MVEMKEQLEVSDLKGNKIGVMNVSDYLRVCIYIEEMRKCLRLESALVKDCASNICLYVL
jgi:hypothetical protein